MGKALTAIRFAYRSLCQFPLQSAPVQAEPARGFGNIAIAFGQHALDMFPFQAF
jgi:hypothetical protein